MICGRVAPRRAFRFAKILAEAPFAPPKSAESCPKRLRVQEGDYTRSSLMKATPSATKTLAAYRLGREAAWSSMASGLV
jgi:hypothetical protein